MRKRQLVSSAICVYLPKASTNESKRQDKSEIMISTVATRMIAIWWNGFGAAEAEACICSRLMLMKTVQSASRVSQNFQIDFP
jgi:hypothetical protein